MNMQQHKNHMAIKNLEQKLYKDIKIDGFIKKDCDYKTDDVLPEIDSSWESLKGTDRFGGKADGHCWFYKKITTTSSMSLSVKTGREGQWDAINPQFLVYINGEIIQGLDTNHTEVDLFVGDNEVYLYAYFGKENLLIDFSVSLRVTNEVTKQLYYDLKVPFEVSLMLDDNDKISVDLVSCLSEAVNLVEYRDERSFQMAIDFLKVNLYQKGESLNRPEVICIGHTHIDVAWLWTFAQTREKVVRSFSTVVKLMEKYPEYKFMSSQAQLFKYLKQEAPKLFEKVKKLVAEGRFEIEGAMWVEADCNLSSGESLVRQVMFGKRFFKEEFGVESTTLWLPDVFGYSAALPQILRKSGVDKFVTSKISWNEFNKMPHDTFLWQGIDGTEIFTYFLTAQEKQKGRQPENYTTYNANITPCQIMGTWERYQDKGLTNQALSTFGFGDGGGGPTEEMLENQRRLGRGIATCPKTKIATATSFLDSLKEKAKMLPNGWVSCI